MQRKLKLGYLIQLVLAVYIMISIKPYIFLALLPGSFVWWGWSRIIKVKFFFLRIIIAPLVILLLVGVLAIMFNSFSSTLGEYGDVDSLVSKAAVTQKDLVNAEAYGENSFNIGEYDETLGGLASKFPIAVFAGLYRPLIIDAKNVVMILSGLENAFLLLFSISTLFLARGKIISSLLTNPLGLYSLIFAIIFAFAIGFSTANYGALVRYKIPCIPFLLVALFIIRHETSKKVPKNQSMLN